jgi:monoamine oxidase
LQTARIAIIGAGLRGLYAAFLLEQQGIRNYVLLEAREAIGGRITSIPASGHSPDDTAAGDNINRFDLGPTWFWPGFQGELDQLVSDLGLARFAQHEDGNMMVERSLIEAPMRMRGFVNSPPRCTSLAAWLR